MGKTKNRVRTGTLPSGKKYSIEQSHSTTTRMVSPKSGGTTRSETKLGGKVVARSSSRTGTTPGGRKYTASKSLKASNFQSGPWQDPSRGRYSKSVVVESSSNPNKKYRSYSSAQSSKPMETVGKSFKYPTSKTKSRKEAVYTRSGSKNEEKYGWGMGDYEVGYKIKKGPIKPAKKRGV